MTARAGLQFVGANVDDDPTNNKTIVDVASAGGIDGVFIDTENVIVPEASYSGSLSYTATEDCVVFVNVLATSSGSGWVYIDNKVVGRTYFVGTAIINGAYYLLKKGQTLTAYSQTYSGIDITYAVYGIQTGTTHSKFQPVIYSTEEREIGVWKDGKPLYQKTLSIPTSSQNTTYDVSSLDIDTCVKIDSFMSGNGSVPDGYWYSSSNYVSVNYYDGDLFINAPTQYSNNSPCIVTLKYTKTSDVAGSGTWTPQGVPTHHYSTDEQVIGTWVDGSTIYEKTIHTGALSTGANSIAHNISNIGSLINAFGKYVYSTYEGTFPFVSIGQNSWNVSFAGCDTTNVSVEVGASYTGNNAITDSYTTIQFIREEQGYDTRKNKD